MHEIYIDHYTAQFVYPKQNTFLNTNLSNLSICSVLKKSNYKFERHPEIWADSWLFMQKNLCWGVFAPGESALSAISILSFKSTEAVEGI